MYKRPLYETVLKRLSEKRRFMQVLAGPRQTGKTTLSQQVIDGLSIPAYYATADEPAVKGPSWLEQQWEAGRAGTRREKERQPAVLVLDEIQKISGWSETVKRLWDEDSHSRLPLQVIILGSSQLLLQQGLTESLAGRFEVIHVPHWSFGEIREAFSWDIDQYIYYGGYPGAAGLITEPERWRSYVMDSLIETTVSRDILHMARVDKPALLRRLFELACSYSGQVLSYQKMLGQLQDAGNTTTLAHYLDLLGGAGLVTGLQKYAGERLRQRGSSPKLQVLNTSLITAQSHYTYKQAQQDHEHWGRLVDSAVGATLANGLLRRSELFYWAGNNRELDFVLRRGKKLVAIEVKSGRKKQGLPGIEAFSKEFPVTKKLLVGTGGIRIEDFLLTPPEAWLE
jgi:predicted AAA+ superfamily ATPase